MKTSCGDSNSTDYAPCGPALLARDPIVLSRRALGHSILAASPGALWSSCPPSQPGLAVSVVLH